MALDALKPGRRLRPLTRYLLVCLLGASLLPFVTATRPLTAPLSDRVEIADLTWVEVRSLLAAGWLRSQGRPRLDTLHSHSLPNTTGSGTRPRGSASSVFNAPSSCPVRWP